MVSSRGLLRSYGWIAPFYDVALTRLLRRSRRLSIESAQLSAGQSVLLCGIGTGLDLPHLPGGVRATGFDLTPAMLKRASACGRGCSLLQADAEHAPFASGSFDAVILHLILAIVPDGRRAFFEAVRVARRGAPIVVFDKFLADGKEPSALRRIANRFTRPIATGLVLRFADVRHPEDPVEVVSDHADLLGGTFRRILLRKR